MTTNADRTRSIRIPVDDHELALVHELAHVRRLTVTALLRALVVEEAKRLRVKAPKAVTK